MDEEEFHNLLKTLFFEKKKGDELTNELKKATEETSLLHQRYQEKEAECLKLRLELEKKEAAANFLKKREMTPPPPPMSIEWRKEKFLLENKIAELSKALESKESQIKKEKERGGDEKEQMEKERQQLIARLADNLTFVQRQMETIKELKKQMIGLQKEVEMEKANRLALEEKYYSRLNLK